MEDPIIIQMNIAHYQALLKLDLSPDKRSSVEERLVETKRALTLATASTRTPR